MIAIFVFCLNCEPSWAMNEVGITSFCPQKLPLALAGRFAASAEYLPSGRYSSKLETWTSGTFSNVLEVMPCLEMNVSPIRSIRTP